MYERRVPSALMDIFLTEPLHQGYGLWPHRKTSKLWKHSLVILQALTSPKFGIRSNIFSVRASCNIWLFSLSLVLQKSTSMLLSTFDFCYELNVLVAPPVILWFEANSHLNSRTRSAWKNSYPELWEGKVYQYISGSIWLERAPYINASEKHSHPVW